MGESAMTAVAEVVQEREGAAPAPRPSWRSRAVLAGLVAVVVLPIVLAGFAIARDPWWPMGDWATMAYRTSQVGTRNTPLVGAYTVKGWAHPGPLLFWLGAPLFKLTGGDARALGWTAGIINVATVAAIAAVAWRRGRWALTVGVMLLVAVLIHGIGPETLVDLWNPYIPVLPFLLTVLLVWDAALGRRRALVEAAVPACFAMQCHLAFVSLVAVMAVWLWAWSRWWPRLVPADRPAAAELPRPPWSRWWRSLRWAVLVVAVLSVGPLIDAVVDIHNPVLIAWSFGGREGRLGIVDAVGLVGRYVRPDGPWMGGPIPQYLTEVRGSGPLPVVIALGALYGCLRVARRRGLVDVVALACLAMTLVVTSIPMAAQFLHPVEQYLAEWIKVVGGLVWFTVAWTLWRLVEPAVRAVPARRVAAGALAGAALVGMTAWTWGPATEAEPRFPTEGEAVRRLGDELAGMLPRDETIRVERRGEPWHIFTPGLIYDLIDRGYDIQTSDGAAGLKWGHEHRWTTGEPYDRLLTVAVHDAGAWSDAVGQCLADPDAELLALYDDLSPDERAWLEDLKLRRLEGPDAVTAEEVARGDELEARGLRIGVFEGPRPCASDRSLAPDSND